jgi:membrane protease YdiL (CAAX protease family)
MAEGTSESCETAPLRWGVWATFAWALAALGVLFMAVGAAKGVIFLINSPELNKLMGSRDGFLALTGIPGGLVVVGVLVLAAYLSRRPVAAYLGLLPSRVNGDVIGTTIATLLVPTLMFTVVGASLGYEFDPPRQMVGPITWPVALLWIFTAIITPLYEELLFRGLLYRGLSESRLGVTGSVLVTAIWSCARSQAGLVRPDLPCRDGPGIRMSSRQQRLGMAVDRGAWPRQWTSGADRQGTLVVLVSSEPQRLRRPARTGKTVGGAA